MSKVCEVCGKGPQTGNNVSHSMRHTKRRFMPNLVDRKLYLPAEGKSKRLRICTKCLKTTTKG